MNNIFKKIKDITGKTPNEIFSSTRFASHAGYNGNYKAEYYCFYKLPTDTNKHLLTFRKFGPAEIFRCYTGNNILNEKMIYKWFNMSLFHRIDGPSMITVLKGNITQRMWSWNGSFIIKEEIYWNK